MPLSYSRRVACSSGLSSLLLLAAACGGDDGGPPIDAPGGDTTAPVTSASPDGGEVRGLVTLTANEPATIYYSTDGNDPTTSSPQLATTGAVTLAATTTSLRFFAVDAAGNQEAIRTLAVAVHPYGPRPVERIRAHASTSGADLEVDWMAPSGAATIAVVRARGELTAGPVDLESLAVGASLGGGTVVYAGTGTSFVDAAPPIGGHVYTAFVQYGNGVWSEARSAGAAIRPAQDGSIQFNLTAATATVTQPANLTLAVSNITYSSAAGTLAFDLATTSNLPSPIFGAKVVFPNVGTGVDALLDGQGAAVGQMAAFTPYPGGTGVSLGATALAPGAIRTVRVTLNNLGGLTTHTQPIAIHAGRGVYSTRWCGTGGSLELSDPSLSVAARGFAELPVFRPDQACPTAMAGSLSPAGAFAFTGARMLPRVTKFDTSTGAAVASLDLDLDSAAGSVTDVALDPSGRRLWAVLNDGMHAYSANRIATAWDGRRRGSNPNAVFLVEIDPATLTEVGRVELGRGDPRFRGHRLALSRDGRRLAVAVGWPYDEADVISSSKVALVDGATRTVIDADPGTAAVDLIDLPDAIRSSECAFSWSGARLVCGNSWHGNGTLAVNTDAIAVADLTAPTLVMASIDVEPATTNQFRAIAFTALPDGSFWLAGDTNGLVKLAADLSIVRIGTERISAHAYLVLDDAPDRIVVVEGGRLSAVDPLTGTVNYLSNGGAYSHRPMVTPY